MSKPPAGAPRIGPGKTAQPRRSAGGLDDRRRTARAPLLFLCAAFAVVFGGLGIWQVERLFWKLDLIARVDARIHAEPIPAPGPQSFTAPPTGESEYRRVQLDGRFLNDRETLVQAVTEQGGGFWVMTPFITNRGFVVLVNRGFVPPERRAPDSRADGQIEGPARLIGLMRLTEPGGGFLRENDPATERWYSRDVAAIAEARGLDKLVAVAPYFVDADAAPVAGGFPVGGLTVVGFSNNHLIYALTWFALAALCGGGFVVVWRRRV
ncbi:SURF1 family protein [Ancylobacter amanitiformis]|uniref:SURF1-like protein n=1 Tax=Ancylobacter amanitiformis TaxID=217069 RepID=A0ABU0LSD2_9HYPH|nr:surfeit locus 1 family protein [Ancylobacter amanitiformis]